MIFRSRSSSRPSSQCKPENWWRRSRVRAGARTAVLLAWALAAAVHAAAATVIDGFEDPAPWSALHTDDVSAQLSRVAGKKGAALHLDFDFTDAHGNPINGYATARRALALDWPDNYEIGFWVRGEAGVNNLQF